MKRNYKWAKYFKRVGTFLVAEVIIGFIITLIIFIRNWVLFWSLVPPPKFLYFLLDLFLIAQIYFFAPALGLAFIALGNIMIEREQDEFSNNEQTNEQTNKNSLAPEETPKQATFILSLDNERYSVKKIASEAANVIIPSVHKNKPISKIEDNAFENCSKLKNITIPDSIIVMGNGVFYNCITLASVTISKGLTSIGDWAFSGCRSLTKLTIPASVTSIGKAAFSNCSSLISIKIPDSVTSIGDKSFYECCSLESITIPNSVTCIGAYTFGHCFSLASVTIPKSVTSIGRYAFNDCSVLTTVYYTGTEEQWNAITIEEGNDKLTNANIIYNYKG